MTYLGRFFVAAPPIPPLMVSTFAALAVLSVVVLLIDSSRGRAVVMPLIVLQAFAASSGFAAPARRGHYDLLLTRGEGRFRLALAHWLLSIAPGAAAWAVVCIVEIAVTGRRGAALASGTAAALVVVSALPWGVGVAMPRFAAAIGWMLVLVTVGSLAPPGALGAWLASVTDGRATAVDALVFLAYPLSVVGARLEQGGALAALPGVVLSACAVAAACAWIARTDFPLEAAQ